MKHSHSWLCFIRPFFFGVSKVFERDVATEIDSRQLSFMKRKQESFSILHDVSTKHRRENFIKYIFFPVSFPHEPRKREPWQWQWVEASRGYIIGGENENLKNIFPLLLRLFSLSPPRCRCILQPLCRPSSSLSLLPPCKQSSMIFRRIWRRFQCPHSPKLNIDSVDAMSKNWKLFKQFLLCVSSSSILLPFFALLIHSDDLTAEIYEMRQTEKETKDQDRARRRKLETFQNAGHYHFSYVTCSSSRPCD